MNDINIQNEYAEEAKKMWGNTEAYKQSQERVKNMTKDDWARYQKGADELMKKLVTSMNQKPDSKEVQTLIAQHYNNLRTFYEPNIEMYKGLAEMYLSDPRFATYFEKYAKGFAQFMHDAMIAYCDSDK
jgi:ribonuclease BN (tRNA processing enzyme)